MALALRGGCSMLALSPRSLLVELPGQLRYRGTCLAIPAFKRVVRPRRDRVHFLLSQRMPRRLESLRHTRWFTIDGQDSEFNKCCTGPIHRLPGGLRRCSVPHCFQIKSTTNIVKRVADKTLLLENTRYMFGHKKRLRRNGMTGQCPITDLQIVRVWRRANV